jgi:thioredoxin reductase (NADPH)
MPKPVLLTVDDDPDVLRAVERDLRKEYAENYRVLRADSGTEALDLLRKLEQRNDPVALLLADHRMPQMNGIEFLAEAMKIFPNACRVLLTAYADTDAAIQAINTIKLHHYLLKPWDPPEENLYPVINELRAGQPVVAEVLRSARIPGAESGPLSMAGYRGGQYRRRG